jgi:pyruvate,orthophosphate dikinase
MRSGRQGQARHELDTDLTRRRLARADRPYKETIEEELGEAFPQDPRDQLWGAIGAVFGSAGCNPRAITYRRCTTFRKPGARPSTSRPWCSAIWASSSHRRGLHAQSIDRREGALRRIPRQRAGRGRGRRHPHAAIAHRKRAIEAGESAPSLEEADARGVCRVHSPSATCSRPLPRHAGHGVHHQNGTLWMLQTRSGKRTAQGGDEDRRRYGQRGADQLR